MPNALKVLTLDETGVSTVSSNGRPCYESYYIVSSVEPNGRLAGSYKKVGSDALLGVNR